MAFGAAGGMLLSPFADINTIFDDGVNGYPNGNQNEAMRISLERLVFNP